MPEVVSCLSDSEIGVEEDDFRIIVKCVTSFSLTCLIYMYMYIIVHVRVSCVT